MEREAGPEPPAAPADASGETFTVNAGPPAPTANRLLAALRPATRDTILPTLEAVSLRPGATVCQRGQRLDHLYFPTNAILALTHTLEGGATAETGLVGNEGAAGIALFLGGNTAPSEMVVSVGGYALRMRPRDLHHHFHRIYDFRAALLRYTHAMLTQVSQNAVCNRLHTVDTRLCRWLLLTRDRTQSREIRMTQEFIANMLGVRRECVTLAAHRLQDAGLIRNGRGSITILDDAGLEAAVCECYGVVRTEFERLFGPQPVVS